MDEELDVCDRMPFGKHRGTLIGTVIEEDARYMRWAVDNTDLLLNDAALAYLEENEA